MALSQDQIGRYSRHLLLPEVGVQGQEEICKSRILCVGTGGLGSPVSLYLAAAGVGQLGLIDFDIVDKSNLQRQIAHGEATVGQLKVESARNRIADLNSDINVFVYNEKLTSANALEIFKNYDVIVDGTDNFPTRYLANDACVLLKKPYVYGCILKFEGQVSVFDSRRGPCYRCLYPEPPPPGLVPSCAEGGVLGVLCGVIGCLQATEAIKLVLNKGNVLNGRLILYDALEMKFREMKLRKDNDCPICGHNPTIKDLVDYEQFCGIPPSKEEKDVAEEMEIEPMEVKRMIDGKESFKLVDVREPGEYEICKIDGSILIPLGDIKDRKPQKLNGLRKSDLIITQCHHGKRSLMAAKVLRDMGYVSVKSMRGGIEEWALQIDESLARY